MEKTDNVNPFTEAREQYLPLNWTADEAIVNVLNCNSLDALNKELNTGFIPSFPRSSHLFDNGKG